MYKVCAIIIMLSVSCLAMPTHRLKRSLRRSHLKRAGMSVGVNDSMENIMYELLMNEMYIYLGVSPGSSLSSSQIADFFHDIIGKPRQMADNFGIDYIFWGDENDDRALNRSELRNAMKTHQVFRYI